MPAKFSPLMRAGWPVAPLVDKVLKATGVTGKNGVPATVDEVKRWAKVWPTANPAIVMPRNVIGLDVDNDSHGEGVDGLKAIEAFEEKFGPLPETGHIFHGYLEDGSPSPYGTYLYRVPDSMVEAGVYTPEYWEPAKCPDTLEGVVGVKGVDIIKWWHRYNVAPGAVHSSGEVYEFTPSPVPGTPWLPSPSDLPELTPRQVKGLLKKRKARQTGATPPVAAPRGSKPLLPPEPPRGTPERKRALLAQVEALAALPENGRLLIEGKERGWQEEKGFYTLACAMLREAGDVERAHRAFLKAGAEAAKAGHDLEHDWQGALNDVDAKDEVGKEVRERETAYPVSLAVSPAEFASELLDREFRNEPGVLTLRHFDGGFWLWERGRFVFVDPDDAEALLTAKMSGAIETAPDGERRPVPWKTAHKRELLAALKDRARDSRYGLGGQLLPSEGGIPFLNGFLDVGTGELTPIGPERKIQWVIDAEYDPGAECPRWEQFLKSCGFGPDTDEYRLIRQWFGYLVSGSKKYEKGMLLIGKSRAGKGVMIRVAQALFGGVGLWGGAMAVEAETLVESHGYEGMPGKGLITLPETRFTGQDRKINARLLSLTSNDAVRINPKMKKPFSTVLPGRLMIGTNETPHFVEATDALAKRLLVVRFNVSHADNPNTNLYSELVEELPGIARWALDGVVDLENEGKFTETDAGREVTEMIVAGGSYLREFLTDCFDRGTDEDRVSNTDMHRVYKEWAKDTGAVPMSSTMLSSRFTDTFPDIGRYKSGDKRGRVGLQVKPKYAHLLKLIYGDEDE